MSNPATTNTWAETKSKIRARFGKLTDQNVESAKDDLDLLKGKIQSAYGYARDQAERELKNFRATLVVAPEPEKPAVVEAPVSAPAVAAPTLPPAPHIRIV